MEHPISTVIPGVDTLEQVDQNASAGDNPLPLTGEERKSLEGEASSLGNAFYMRCEYCQPCPQGIERS
jgi:predicted aldo/keto reductase-like oxidoreductase